MSSWTVERVDTALVSERSRRLLLLLVVAAVLMLSSSGSVRIIRSSRGINLSSEGLLSCLSADDGNDVDGGATAVSDTAAVPSLTT